MTLGEDPLQVAAVMRSGETQDDVNARGSKRKVFEGSIEWRLTTRKRANQGRRRLNPDDDHLLAISIKDAFANVPPGGLQVDNAGTWPDADVSEQPVTFEHSRVRPGAIGCAVALSTLSERVESG